MSNSKQYNVCVPRKYKDRTGAEKTHFWQVGMAWPMRERDGFTIELYTRVLPTDKLVCFLKESRDPGAVKEEEPPPPNDDDIPF